MHVSVLLVLGTLVTCCTLVDSFFLNKDNCKKGKCAGKAFDIGTHICCVDQLYERKTWTECCCGWKVLDTTKEKCCNDFVIRLEDKCLADPVKHEQRAPVEQEEQAAVEQEEQAAVEQEEQAAVEQEKQAAVEQEEQAAVEQEEQAAVEQEEQAAVEQAAVEQEEQAAVEQEEQSPVEQEEQAPVEQDEEETIDTDV
ncbi:hypothetical protein NP493_1395g00042 [Ridgeia piscesae]|uniref:Uncharacterized protein n=1 Tax=Ridgeia piscesae TaxID=27915 RepID=A0AAD9K4F3_RIDPI|nr:hypothetical protein NP493_1395g00042 [Ridgeia piscesae]